MLKSDIDCDDFLLFVKIVEFIPAIRYISFF